MNCPTCNGECYDNRPRKSRGQMKATAPDFACKDKDGCGWKQWPPKGSGTPLGTQSTNGGKRTGSLTWGTLGRTYARCYEIAGRVVGNDSPDRQAATATLFIACNQHGLSVEPAPAPTPPPPPPQEVVEDDDDY